VGEGKERDVLPEAALSIAAPTPPLSPRPRLQQLGLPLSCETRVRGRLGVLECSADSFVERSESETGRQCPRDVGLVEPAPLRVPNPERQLRPFAHALFYEEAIWDPHDTRSAAGHPTAGFEQITPRHARVRGVEGADCVVLAELDDPRGKVADVEELHSSIRWCRCEHVAAARDSVRPIGEASCRVMRANQQPCTNIRMASRKRLGDRLFAESL
jgi:hypothetical protein